MSAAEPEAGGPGPSGAATVPTSDDGAWDDFVASTGHGSYLQLAAWAAVKAANGWAATRVGATTPDGRVAAQVLVRRPRPLPWGFGYAPRGPVAERWTADAIAALSERIRSDVPRALGRVSHVRIDPEIEADGPDDPDGALRRALREAGWRAAPPIQPATTRVIDLAPDEAALWGDLRKKWRQYVNRARAAGVRVVEADVDRIGDFYRIYRETADRAGFLIRTEAAYRGIFAAYRPAGRASLLFAESPEGEPLATLFLVQCGRRVVEPYGGMTAGGAELRANYLLKWEAIRRSREAGAATYDLWGLAHPGIAHFKAGFGGRELAYVGAWDLVLDPVGWRAIRAAQSGRTRLGRIRYRTAATDLGATPDGPG